LPFGVGPPGICQFDEGDRPIFWVTYPEVYIVHPHLKLFSGYDDEPIERQDDEHAAVSIGPVVRIRLRDLLPLVAMAQRNHFIWLKDFLDDEIAVSDDLHDVLMAFQSTKPA
jgi:hypothetical protein